MRRVTNTNLLFWVLTYQSLNRALPSRKCSIKTPAKCKTSVYVLTEICLQWSKWLVPKLHPLCLILLPNMSCFSNPEALITVILVIINGGDSQNLYHLEIGTSLVKHFKSEFFSQKSRSKKSVVCPGSNVVGKITYLPRVKLFLRKMCLDLM